MKNTVLTILLVLSNLLAFSQIPKDAVAFEDPEFNEYLKTRKVPIVKGKISNISLEEIKKTSISYTIVTALGGEQNHKTAQINADGTFSLELDNSFPYQEVWFYINGKLDARIFAHEELLIELDWQKTKDKKIYMISDGIIYSGKDGEMNTYLNTYSLFEKDRKKFLTQAIGNYIFGKKQNLPYSEFIVIYDSLSSEIEKIDNAFVSQNPSKYAWIIKDERLSVYYGGIISKHGVIKTMDKDLWNDLSNHKTYLASSDGILFNRFLYNFLDSKESYPKNPNDFDFMSKYYCQSDKEREKLKALIALVKNTPLQDSALYRSNMNKKAEYTLSLYRDTETRVIYPKLMAYLDSAFSPAKADFLKMNERWERQDVNIRKKKIEIALASMKTPWCKDLLMKEYQITLDKINEVNGALSKTNATGKKTSIGEMLGETPFGAKLYKVDSGKGLELLANLKETFKGKALLLDFWGTWCAPCLQELPISKKLHEETKELPLEYVYLCTSDNSTVEKWKNKIAELKISGTHIFVDEAIETELMNKFQSTGFPSYRFIDRNGKYKQGAITWMSQTNKTQLKALVEGK